MQSVDWITNEAGHPTTLVYDRKTTMAHRRRANRTAVIGLGLMVSICLLSVVTQLALGLVGLFAFIVAVLVGSAQGSAQLWYRRVTIEGPTLKLEWIRRRGHPDSRQAPSTEEILDTREERLLFAAPAPLRIPLMSVSSVRQVEQTLTLEMDDGPGLAIPLTDVLPEERDRLVDALHAAADRAREASEPVGDGTIAAMATLRRSKALDA